MTSDDNKIRLRRMDVWIKHAENLPETEFHLQFICYWIAFDAAFAQFAKGNNGDGMARMHCFLRRVADADEDGHIRKILKDHRSAIERIFELRQTCPAFWNKNKSKALHPSTWESEFVEIKRQEESHLKSAILDRKHVSLALMDLFNRLNVVRNQIFHGGSSGAHSHGRTQVRLGALLLSNLIPCFRQIMPKSTDWGAVPFPPLGNPNQQGESLPPPWI